MLRLRGTANRKGTNGSFYLLGFWAAWSGELELRTGIHIDHQFFRICCGEIYGAMRPNSAIDSGFGVQPARLRVHFKSANDDGAISMRTAANV